MSTPKIFGVYGYSNTGKTTLLVQIATQLIKEGYTVVIIKQTKKAISMDTKNKDTWRHHQAGPHLVVFSSRSETDFLLSEHLSTSKIIRRISAFGDYDIILIEGADDPVIPKIQVGAGKKRSNTIATYDDNFKEILALLKSELKEQPSIPDLSIIVNGKEIQLTQFPAQIISNSIIGMLGSLKGVQTIDEVTIQLKR